MAAVRIVTDSSCDLTTAETSEHRIGVVPLSIRFGDDEYVDREQLSVEDFYAKMASTGLLPETAAPSPGRFEQEFRGAVESGASGVVCINLSGELSATVQSARTAAKALEGELDVRVIDTVCISSYDHETQRAAAVLKSVASDADGAGWLIVDDLVDTGATGRIVREMLPKAHFATIYAKPAGRPVVDTFITEVSQDTWILFPWDTEPQYAQPIAGRAGRA